MKATLVDFGKDAAVYRIEGATRNELENKLNLFFGSQDLPLKKDNGNEKIYEKGNKVVRVLFGVFVKYFKIKLEIEESNGLFTVKMIRNMNLVLSGGLAGIHASRKKFGEISDAFKTYFSA